MSRKLLFMATIVLAAQGGCALHGQARCLAGEQDATSELIYFGTAKPGGVVSPEEWGAYLTRSVTPRFPTGLSVWSAAGQWQSASGAIVQEASFVLSLVYKASEAHEAAVRALVAEYRLQFQQEAVLRVKSHACVSL